MRKLIMAVCSTVICSFAVALAQQSTTVAVGSHSDGDRQISCRVRRVSLLFRQRNHEGVNWEKKR